MFGTPSLDVLSEVHGTVVELSKPFPRAHLSLQLLQEVQESFSVEGLHVPLEVLFAASDGDTTTAAHIVLFRAARELIEFEVLSFVAPFLLLEASVGVGGFVDAHELIVFFE